MSRIVCFVYGLVSYALFLGVFLYTIGFVHDAWVPTGVSKGSPGMSLAAAALINIGLIALFGLQHSVMARRGFKRLVTRLVPQPAERSTYVLASNLALALVYLLWQPMPTVLWSVTDPSVRAVMTGISLAGFGLVVLASFFIDHFDLFGVRQVTLHLLGKPYTDKPFATPFFYRYVRHPLYVGWLLGFWVAPTMTAGHLLFSSLMTGYILFAIVLEERDLVAHFGEVYLRYRERVPALIPLSLRRDAA